MNEYVKNCVDSRKMAIYNTYDIKKQENIDYINDYFKRLEEFASNYNDAMSFEQAFQTSSFNQEYMDIFTKITKTESVKEEIMAASASPVTDEDDNELQDDLTRAVRREARQEAYDKARDIPVVGDVMTAKQHFDFFSRFRKKDE